MRINVVIPAYRPDEKLIHLVSMLKKQTVSVSKVIIMHTLTADADRYRKVIDELDFDAVEVHDLSVDEFDHGKTRNEGVSYTEKDCDIVILMTQDAVPYDERLVEELVKPFSEEKTGATYGRQMADENSTLAEKFTRNFNYPDEDRVKTLADIETIGIKAFFCSNVCAAYRMTVFRELGGFVNRAIFNEDMIYANKLLKSGYDIAYASKARVIHTHDYSGKQQYKRNFDLAVSQAMNPQAFEGISSESEGVRYVKAAFKYFAQNKKPLKIIPFGINCVYKYLGYRKGKNYKNLSMKKIMKCTSNPGFWKLEEGK